MTRSLITLAVPACILALAVAATPALAHQTIYAAPFWGPSETPPNDSPGTGQATVTIDFDTLMMRVQASFSGLEGPVSAAHIHCCTEQPGTGNVGVASQTPTFSGFPSGVTAGVYDATFDMAEASSYNATFITAHGGNVADAFNALVAGLDGGRAYFNIHTTQYPAGEIRALLTPVPEAEVWLMAGAGLLVVGLAGLRSRPRQRP